MTIKNAVQIVVRAFEGKVIHQNVDKIKTVLDGVTTGKLLVQPLPTKIQKYTVNRSPHVNKKSREQFETRTYRHKLTQHVHTPEEGTAVLQTLQANEFYGVELSLKILYPSYSFHPDELTKPRADQ
mmetsp:Transcript_29520/g.35859  ORF Transcript_29520/g.35859 Transcript_29520/m.35859 type:complete len:126 (-) Transcript_29520:926-1303(-)